MHKYNRSLRKKGNNVSYNMLASQDSEPVSADWYDSALDDAGISADSIAPPDYPEVVQSPTETAPPVNTEVISRPPQVPDVSIPKITKKNTAIPAMTKSDDTLFNLNSVMVLLFIAGAAFLLMKSLKKSKFGNIESASFFGRRSYNIRDAYSMVR
tara:strand:- start:5358 stop:5822 length:465 start_codon:yes stop_codon:yes gene_type:complete